MFTTAQQFIDTIENMKHFHKGLDSFKEALNELNNPHLELQSKVIHVAGTNGKGSTVNYLRSILQTAGYTVGSFTSPYLVVHEDRIRINNEYISSEWILRFANTYWYLIEKYSLSMFEVDMMMACLYFKEHDVDYMIFEVGMGGRLDATNVFPQPLCTVITHIGMDHMAYLGDTFEKIAAEKAGIIKNHIPMITHEKREDCLAVFRNVCEERNSKMITCQPIELVDDYKDMKFIYKNHIYQLESLAQYQCDNASLAIEIIHYLNDSKQTQITEEIIQEGLRTQWAGRFEKVHESPLVLIDGAHNEDGIDALVESLRSYSDIKIIFSALKDKNSDKMLEKLCSISEDVTVCEFDFYRAQSAEVLAQNHPVMIEKDYKKAIDKAFNQNKMTIICGSLYFISIVRAYILEK